MNRDTERLGAAADEAFLDGYGHGYDIGRAHGRAELTIEHDPDVPAQRLDRPSCDELVGRGHIQRDTTRPPALPVRLWNAEDWAKASVRDLPATDTGRAHWREAIAAGHVPPALAEAFTARESAEPVEADARRVLAHLRGRGRSHPDAPATGLYDTPDDRWRAAVDTLRAAGHRIDTTLVIRGDRTGNEHGHVLDDHHPAAAAPRTAAQVTAAIRAAVDDTARRLAELREHLGQADLDAAYQRTAERDRQRAAEATRWFEQHHAAHTGSAELEADWTAGR